MHIMKLDTSYMGLKLSSPVIVSASTLSEKTDNIVQMEDNGAGAVVMFSLFEEQIREEEARLRGVLSSTVYSFPEAQDYFPDLDDFNVGIDEYLENIRKARERVHIPIIGSLNGFTSEGWTDYSRMIEQAGADALEVNIFFIPGDIHTSSQEVEHRYLNIIQAVKQAVRIPVAVKLNPYFSATGNMALRMKDAGADALVLFNRFYQPDFDIHNLAISHDLHFSEAGEIRLPLLWIALLYDRLGISLAATTGVQSATEVIKYLLAGADVVMTASSLYKFGIPYLRTMNEALRQWMRDLEFESVDAFRGILSQKNISDPTAYERVNYIRILQGVR